MYTYSYANTYKIIPCVCMCVCVSDCDNMCMGNLHIRVHVPLVGLYTLSVSYSLFLKPFTQGLMCNPTYLLMSLLSAVLKTE